MRDNLKVAVGDRPNAAKYNRLVDKVRAAQSGNPAIVNASSAYYAYGKNNTGQDIDIGEVMHIDDWDGIDDWGGSSERTIYEVPGNVLYEFGLAVWHTAIGRAVIAAEPIPDGEYGLVVLSGQCVVKAPVRLDGSQNPISETGNREFVMINPETTTEMIVVTGGIGRVLHRVNDDYVMANFRDGRPKFRYTITSHPATNFPYTATLHEQAGERIGTSATINIHDYLDITDYQEVGDEGYVELAGNYFYPVEGPC